MIVVVMVITYVVGGMDFERHESMPDSVACWAAAPMISQRILDEYPMATQVGVGCVVMKPDPV